MMERERDREIGRGCDGVMEREREIERERDRERVWRSDGERERWNNGISEF